MKWIDKIFGKKNKESQIADGFFTSKEIIVDSELAFKPSIKKEIENVKKKILVSDDDFNNLKFDDELDLNEYNLKMLSEDSKRKIIEIIREDSKNRIYGQNKELARLVASKSMKFKHEIEPDNKIYGEDGIIYTPTNEGYDSKDELTKGEHDTDNVSVKNEEN